MMDDRRLSPPAVAVAPDQYEQQHPEQHDAQSEKRDGEALIRSTDHDTGSGDERDER